MVRLRPALSLHRRRLRRADRFDNVEGMVSEAMWSCVWSGHLTCAGRHRVLHVLVASGQGIRGGASKSLAHVLHDEGGDEG